MGQRIFIYQYGFTRVTQYGDQLFELAINEKIKKYVFPEGEHVSVEEFIQELRDTLNGLQAG